MTKEQELTIELSEVAIKNTELINKFVLACNKQPIEKQIVLMKRMNVTISSLLEQAEV